MIKGVNTFSHSFPDPIPPGIMEEACDWDVIIEPPSKPSRKVPVSPKQEKRKRVKSDVTSCKPSRASEVPHPIEERKPCDEFYNGAETKAKKHSKPRMEKPLPSATNLETRSTLTRTELSDSLPKIPSLPSFKSRARGIMTFAEAEADYESFMSEGPGRFVEIIRQYEGFNRSQTNGLHNNHDDHDHDHESHVPNASHSLQDRPPPPELTPGSKTSDDSLSSDNDSSSESKMEVESESNSSIANRIQHKHHTQVLSNNVSHIQSSADCNKHQRDQSSAARIQTHSRNKQTHKPQSHNPPHHKGPTASKSSRKAMTTKQRFTKEKTEDVEVAGQDYWNAYRAWMEYYNSYYHRSPYYWMRAFSSYSNYMMEMMKR